MAASVSSHKTIRALGLGLGTEEIMTPQGCQPVYFRGDDLKQVGKPLSCTQVKKLPRGSGNKTVFADNNNHSRGSPFAKEGRVLGKADIGGRKRGEEVLTVGGGDG